MDTSNCDLGGSSTLLKKVNATTLAISTRFEVAAIDKLIVWFIDGSALQGANDACRQAWKKEVQGNSLRVKDVNRLAAVTLHTAVILAFAVFSASS
jgi:hypothetical protein